MCSKHNLFSKKKKKTEHHKAMFSWNHCNFLDFEIRTQNIVTSLMNVASLAGNSAESELCVILD